MPYTNRCPILLQPLEQAETLLIKVPKTVGEDSKDVYYYLGDKNILNQISLCPITRRKGIYYVLPLTDDIAAKLIKTTSSDELIEDNTTLAKIDAENKFKWQQVTFGELYIENRNPQEATIEPELNENESNSHQSISDYKANVLKAFLLPRHIIFIYFHRRDRELDLYNEILSKLTDQELLESHDLIFLIKSFKMVLELDNCRFKKILMNLIQSELTKYIAGAMLFSRGLAIILGLLQNGFSLVTCSNFLEIMFISWAQDRLTRLFIENPYKNIVTILLNLSIDDVKRLITGSDLYDCAQTGTANAYQFAKTNLSFFANKLYRITEEVPENLAANSVREYR